MFYVFTDKAGKTHIQDTVSAELQKNGYRVVSEQGITLEVVPPEKQRIQSASQAESSANQESERDTVLLRTFSNVQELERTRDDKLTLIDNIIASTQVNIDASRRSLLALAQRKKELEDSGQAVPAKVSNDIALLSKRIEKNSRFIDDQRMEHENVRQRYASDIVRFQELTQPR